MSWFRYHIDAIDNPKVQSLPAVLFRFWVNLLCVAKISDGFLPTISEISFRCRCSEPQAREWIAELKRRKLIDEPQSNELFMHDWNGHQFSSDSSTERTRKHRAKRSGNVPVTPPEQNRAEQTTETEQSRTEPAPEIPDPPLPGHLFGLVSKPANGNLDAPLQRFESWWEIWKKGRGTNHRMAAEGMFVRVVPAELQVDCLACTASYLQSLNGTSGFNPENFLNEQAREKFAARWPTKNGPGRAGSFTDSVTRAMERRVKAGMEPL